MFCGVGRDNGDERVRKVVLFHPRANEISRENNGVGHDGVCAGVCHATRISAPRGNRESMGPCR